MGFYLQMANKSRVDRYISIYAKADKLLEMSFCPIHSQRSLNLTKALFYGEFDTLFDIQDLISTQFSAFEKSFLLQNITKLLL